MPRGSKWSGFRFAVADDTGYDQLGIVECSTERMREAVAEFAAFVDRTGNFRRAVASEPARERETLEELQHPGFILTTVGIDLRVVAFKITVRQSGGRAMTRTGDVDDVKIVFLYQPVQMNPREGLPGISAPMPQEPVLDVLRFKRLAQQWIGAQIDHRGRHVIAGSPVSVYFAEFFCGECNNVLNSRGQF